MIMVLFVLGVNIQVNNLVNCFGVFDVSLMVIVFGGMFVYIYSWSNGVIGLIVFGLFVGMYIVIVIDVNGCMVIVSFIVMEMFLVNVLIIGEIVVCGVEDFGFVGIIVNGGIFFYIYNWSIGVIIEDIIDLSSGIYFVIVMDVVGCMGEVSIIINVISDFFVNLILCDVLCFGDNNGSVFVVVVGGDMLYIYMWSMGDIGNEIIGLVVGIYFVMVMEVNGCFVEISVIVG